MKTFDDLRKDLAKKDPDLFIALEIVGKLMAARDRKGLSQRELSRLSNVPQKTISRIENGIDIPKIPTLLKLANVLGLEITLIDKTTEEEQAASLN
ncbi:TPA: helix-turn-helix transcriptional regulator [Bacillus cereus]|uniref:helix-turn-helix domain-containing protein n=1 Tax=unclassified Bacillus (in: firmicutes) TaxID=185979 RepID=UPI0005C69045|nr:MULTISPECIES: helix-turn-helix transcriptional regulator [unclassified Bacillus (in: firmicutes)]